MKKTCETCRYVHVVCFRLECCRHAPRNVDTRNSNIAVFPVMYSESSCGDYEPAAPVSDNSEYDSFRGSVVELWNETTARVEHGPLPRAHLEYVQRRLTEILYGKK